ncbi:NUDIX hydrolase [Chengkuizengella marina]|uniref:NUDIX hydrolase n=1 Tax=Chengkuizengella marina TaxID=2507566 RepID=A0A6N9Q6Q1_9BACL|nr:NUDIX hydrolase [Chengkuizengella marina]NBI30536.1 NUDIX hydrolase [Chengkuizengella marina]
MRPIKNITKAAITLNDKILLTKNKDKDGDYFLLPSEPQKSGEQLRVTLKRGFTTKSGYEIDVHEMLYVKEYMAEYYDNPEWEKETHQVDYYFKCNFSKDEITNANKLNLDKNIYEWIDLEALDGVRVYPEDLENILKYGHS